MGSKDVDTLPVVDDAITSNSLRQLIVSFEEEYNAKVNATDNINLNSSDCIDSLAALNKYVLEINQLRHNWLQILNSHANREKDLKSKKLDVLRTRVRIAELEIQLSIKKLEQKYQDQELIYLIDATDPHEGLSDSSAISHELNKGLKQHEYIKQYNKKLLITLKETYQNNEQLLKQLQSYSLSLNNISEDSNGKILQGFLQSNEQMQQFQETLLQKLHIVQEKYQKLLSEYLVLRHNTKVSNELIVNSFNQSRQRRWHLYYLFNQFKTDMNLAKENLAISCDDHCHIILENLKFNLDK